VIIGLTGGIGSGKSVVEAAWQRCGLPVLDTDQVARTLTAANGRCIPAIRKSFGDSVIDAEGAMNRAVMRAIVFSDPLKRRELESIVHAEVASSVFDWVSRQPGDCAIAVPLLFERGNLLKHIDRSFVVDCTAETQIQRVMRRSSLERLQVLAVMATQLTRCERLARGDEVLLNEGLSLSQVTASAQHLLGRLTRLT
jgi:dephospho-CoA kinase